MNHNRVMLASVILVLVSILMGSLTFIAFSPITFFIHLSVGVAAGIAGFLGLMSALIRLIRKRKLLHHGGP